MGAPTYTYVITFTCVKIVSLSNLEVVSPAAGMF